jgi:nonsense-mediated mRNA decay protein 3
MQSSIHDTLLDQMSGVQNNTMLKVLCCMCGVPIQPNPSNTCPSCLATKADVTKGISTEATLHQCRGCQRWHLDAGKWIACELESRELMTLCLKNVSGLDKPSSAGGEKVRLIDASWIWTEPHSMRLKVRLTIQKEVQLGTILQQSFVVVFIVRNQQCTECQSEFRQGSWKSLVQVRQRVGHKRTFLFLEQLILKHGAHRGCLSIETFRDGMDFYFPEKNKAARFITFLENVVPIKIKTSKKLISTDDKNNTANFKYTNFVEICPLCKDDLLYLPSTTARNLGNISQLVLVKNISNVIHLIDPQTSQTAQMSPEVFWRDPIRPIITAARTSFTRYIVLQKEPIIISTNASKKNSSKRNRNKMASLTLMRDNDLGVNNHLPFDDVPSHVGYLMKSGDVAIGYDLTDIQFVNDDAENARADGKLPDVIILRKLYGGVATNDVDASKRRMFKLQKLDVDAKMSSAENSKKARKDDEDDEMDEEDFLREIEADKEMRANINLYKSEAVIKKTTNDGIDREEIDDDDDEDDDDQQVKLDELLDGLVLDDDVAGMDDGDEDDEDALDGAKRQFMGEGERAEKDQITYIGRDDARNVKDKDAAVPVGEVFGKEFMNKQFKFM